jgi:hypothetical protein
MGAIINTNATLFCDQRGFRSPVSRRMLMWVTGQILSVDGGMSLT